jgi:transcriptional regulator with XRE-family HTH domain
MPAQKLYAGAKLREVRTRIGLTQKDFAAKLGVSLPYLNQMENNNRPVSTAVVLGLAQEFGLDVTELGSGDTERLVSDMREAIADPVFADTAPPLSDLRLAASNAPALARAFLDLHRAYRQTHERLASLDEALGRRTRSAPNPRGRRCATSSTIATTTSTPSTAPPSASPARPRAISSPIPKPCLARMRRHAEEGRGRRRTPLRPGDAHPDPLPPRRPGDPALPAPLHQFALLAQDQLLEATLDLARFQTDTAREIARIGMANYFAGAVLMPYTRFAEAARDTRHDLEQLSIQFGASIEQVAHRLSTLQRPGAKGVPFFFARVDQAGTVTKRHSATRLQFARYGGACPLWNVHRAFETPGRFLRQLAETPDGARYVILARDVSKSGGAWGTPTRRYAISLGCEVAMPRNWSMPTTSTSTATRRSSPSASPAASANAPIATSARSRRWNAA